MKICQVRFHRLWRKNTDFFLFLLLLRFVSCKKFLTAKWTFRTFFTKWNENEKREKFWKFLFSLFQFYWKEAETEAKFFIWPASRKFWISFFFLNDKFFASGTKFRSLEDEAKTFDSWLVFNILVNTRMTWTCTTNQFKHIKSLMIMPLTTHDSHEIRYDKNLSREDQQSSDVT